MKEIVDEVERWRSRGEQIALATVVATRKSAPRPGRSTIWRTRFISASISLYSVRMKVGGNQLGYMT